ncbi:DUF1380 family protein [uncultured Cedecea sp.]|uniref:DUF1380 family protein n=1 Tax=uncultured Cedecea sp. TaxID=988762 RepID=UPI002616E7BC|nr:DUF1380 family protein [uncultured Cedecea sp.]
MYGTRETICQILAKEYPADTPLNIVVWSPEDVEALAEGIDLDVSEAEVRNVLERIDTISEEERLEYGVSCGAVMNLINQVKVEALNITVPVALLESILSTAEQALWRKEWEAGDKSHPVPESVARRLSDTSRMRALLKK